MLLRGALGMGEGRQDQVKQCPRVTENANYISRLILVPHDKVLARNRHSAKGVTRVCAEVGADK
jgi:hypothetical protein